MGNQVLGNGAAVHGWQPDWSWFLVAYMLLGDMLCLNTKFLTDPSVALVM